MFKESKTTPVCHIILPNNTAVRQAKVVEAGVFSRWQTKFPRTSQCLETVSFGRARNKIVNQREIRFVYESFEFSFPLLFVSVDRFWHESNNTFFSYLVWKLLFLMLSFTILHGKLARGRLGLIPLQITAPKSKLSTSWYHPSRFLRY